MRYLFRAASRYVAQIESESPPEHGGPVGGDGAPLRLLFRSSAAESFQNFNLSPSGRYAAYLVEGSGEIVVVELKTGAKNNLTAKIPALAPDAPEAGIAKARRPI